MLSNKLLKVESGNGFETAPSLWQSIYRIELELSYELTEFLRAEGLE